MVPLSALAGLCQSRQQYASLAQGTNAAARDRLRGAKPLQKHTLLDLSTKLLGCCVKVFASQQSVANVLASADRIADECQLFGELIGVVTDRSGPSARDRFSAPNPPFGLNLTCPDLAVSGNRRS